MKPANDHDKAQPVYMSGGISSPSVANYIWCFVVYMWSGDRTLRGSLDLYVVLAVMELQ
jgi:hypothetical protein